MYGALFLSFCSSSFVYYLLRYLCVFPSCSILTLLLFSCIFYFLTLTLSSCLLFSLRPFCIIVHSILCIFVSVSDLSSSILCHFPPNLCISVSGFSFCILSSSFYADFLTLFCVSLFHPFCPMFSLRHFCIIF